MVRENRHFQLDNSVLSEVKSRKYEMLMKNLQLREEGKETTSTIFPNYTTQNTQPKTKLNNPQHPHVIIDSQHLMVAILAALFVGENTAFLGAAGLVLGVIGLLLLATNNMWMHNFYLVDKDGYLPQRKMLPKQLNVLPLSTVNSL
ncbi:unnamed protein product [Prunus armeniaca]|uniref:Uncharacterized protein n=1 Tax=Prunus armeniaca TaxID=36596 RepID=A0A6J5W2I6_PRUAR|nr:unnamed protein product [Prunus armeniaca]